MRRYETIVILDSDLSEEQRAPVFERLTTLFPQYNGFLIGIDEWGVKKLAYEIKKKPRGYYALINFCGHGDLVDEMERFFRIDDKILKFMTVLLEENVDVDAIKEEIAEKEKMAAEAAAAQEAAAQEAAAQEAAAQEAAAQEAAAQEAAAQAEKEKPVETEAETADEAVDAETSDEAKAETETQEETTEEE
jgi:small subunit ribosomal protein S6